MFVLPASHRRLLNSLNPLVFIALVVLCILIKTALYPFAPLFVQRWDVLLPFVVFFGQRRGLGEGIVLALFASHVYSLSSTAPLGVFTTVYLVIFAAARGVSYIVYATTSLSIWLLMVGLCLLSRLLLPWIGGFFEAGWPLWSLHNWTWWAIVINGSLGWIVYRVLEAVDQLTHKSARIQIELRGGTL